MELFNNAPFLLLLFPVMQSRRHEDPMADSFFSKLRQKRAALAENIQKAKELQ